MQVCASPRQQATLIALHTHSQAAGKLGQLCSVTARRACPLKLAEQLAFCLHRAVKSSTLHSACRLLLWGCSLVHQQGHLPLLILLLAACLHCWLAGLDTSSAQDNSSISDWSEGDHLSGEESRLSDWDADSHAEEQATGAAEDTAAPEQQAAPVADEGWQGLPRHATALAASAVAQAAA